MPVGGKADGKSSLFSGVTANVGEPAMKGRLAAAEPDAQAAVGVQFGEPTTDLIGRQGGSLFGGVAVGTGEVASVGQCDCDVPRSGRPPLRRYPNLIEQTVQPG